MKYNYKIVLLNEEGNHLQTPKMELLNQWFEDGWEYVSTLQQEGYEWSPVGVILRKETDPLN
jgi:hypothetical protein